MHGYAAGAAAAAARAAGPQSVGAAAEMEGGRVAHGEGAHLQARTGGSPIAPYGRILDLNRFEKNYIK